MKIVHSSVYMQIYMIVFGFQRSFYFEVYACVGGYVGVSTGNCRIERHHMLCRKSYRQFAPSRVGAKNQTWIFYKTAM